MSGAWHHAGKDPRWLLALAWLAGFTLIDSSIVSLALPDIANDFDTTVGQLAWVSTGYLLALAATLLAAGRSTWPGSPGHPCSSLPRPWRCSSWQSPGAICWRSWPRSSPSSRSCAGIAITLVASATNALAQFSPEEAGTGSAPFNSLRQLGAAMGVAIPAVAFELVATGSRTADASLAGSTAAFLFRTVVLAVPLVLVIWSGRGPGVATRPETA